MTYSSSPTNTVHTIDFPSHTGTARDTFSSLSDAIVSEFCAVEGRLKK